MTGSPYNPASACGLMFAIIFKGDAPATDGIWMFLFFTVYTAYAVPYKALGAELSTGYHERTRVFATSAFLGFVGALVAIVAIYILERAEQPRSTAPQPSRNRTVASTPIAPLWPPR